MNNSENKTRKQRASSEAVVQAFHAIAIIIFGALIAFFVYSTTYTDSRFEFKLGLDLAGGSHLVYEADVSKLNQDEVPELMSVLRDVIERRVNIFGVSEPIVQVEKSSFVSGEQKQRLVVELPGITDVSQAVNEIGKTPLLEFKLVNSQIFESINNGTFEQLEELQEEPIEPYIDTGLTGRYLKRAELVFGQSHGGGLSNEPIVSIEFNKEGGDLFAEITENNIGEQLAIFLDGVSMSSPVINEKINGGQAVISGGFTAEEARSLVQNLNFGALPVPIELQSTQTVGASLGNEVLQKGLTAAAIGLVLVGLFLIIWYRVLGAVAVIALLIYIVIILALFKLIPVTLTAAGLAGFILSIGMAVDANVLVFERMKEEYLSGKNSKEAAKAGFKRAWTAIRDGNVTSILSAVILFWFGTSIVKGFALVFGIGVFVSMVTALFVTRTLLMALPKTKLSDDTIVSKLYQSGFNR